MQEEENKVAEKDNKNKEKELVDNARVHVQYH
jgi:hypothetical protein